MSYDDMVANWLEARERSAKAGYNTGFFGVDIDLKAKIVKKVLTRVDRYDNHRWAINEDVYHFMNHMQSDGWACIIEVSDPPEILRAIWTFNKYQTNDDFIRGGRDFYLFNHETR